MSLLILDGSKGEGGGQVLRTSLTLSLVTGRPFRIENIRARRSRPGLQRQHLMAVHAAARVGSARVTGDRLGSREIEFHPEGSASSTRAGEYRFVMETAASTTLVLQTILPALLAAAGPSTIVLEGGTHNPMCPPFDFLREAFLPLVCRMGPRIEARIERVGFYPAGGGRLRVQVTPVERLTGLELLERGGVRDVRARALIARLPTHIARRELQVVGEALGLSDDRLEIVEIAESRGPGNVVLISVVSEHITEVFTGYGMKGVRAEKVALTAVDEARRYLAAGAPVGPHLADQLLLPLALAGRGGFRTPAPTSHTVTNVGVIQQFLPVRITTEREADRIWRIDVSSP